MLMTNENVRLYPHDPVVGWLFNGWFPRWILPNHLTITRFALTPWVLALLWQERWGATLGLFLVTAFTDVLDGSLARLRKQITLWGTAADPVADKLLIGSMAIVFIVRVIGWWLALAVLLMEVLVVSGVLYRRYKGRISSANVFGKTKMFLQVMGMAWFLASQIWHIPLFVTVGIVCFLLSFLFAFISFLTYSS
jgi:phosphatidylglycerophosphate synthase